MKKSQPWLNEDGSVKNDAELQEAGHNWSPDVWGEYLSSFEVRRQEGVVLPPNEIDEFSTEEAISLSDEVGEFSAEECADMLFSMAADEKHYLLKLAINACIRGLAPRQREVITGYFWIGKTVKEMATSMGISQQSVRKTMKTALVKLKENLTSGMLRKRIVIAQKLLAA